MTCYVRIGGGFGNQLFQYAFGRALALGRGADVVYETGFYEDHSTQSLAHHRFWLEEIGLPMRRMAFSQARFHTLRRMYRLPLAVQQAVMGVAIVRERFPFTQLPPALDGLLLNGVWANPRYFADAAPTVRAEILDAVGGPLPVGLPVGAVPVAFHVRRGDYLTHHAMANLDYVAYLDAARRLFRDKLGNTPIVFVVFSDDPAWCRSNLAGEDVVFSPGRSMLEDFRMMIGCSHHVISNSTFAWWAAFLGGTSETVVVAPQRWIANQSGRELGLVADDWVEIAEV